MEMSNALQKNLMQLFPNKIIYSAELCKNISVHMALHREAKRAGVSSRQLTESNGFVWKDIERAMDFSGEKVDESLEVVPVINQIYTTQTFLGNAILTEEQRIAVYSYAKSAFDKRFVEGKGLSITEEKAIILETIFALQGRSADDDESQSKIWVFVFKHFCGYTLGQGTTEYQHYYRFFCKAIDKVMRLTNHFLVPTEKNGIRYQGYYDTLLIHALEPADAANRFFSILFDFYVNTLACQYIPGDPAFKPLVKAISKKYILSHDFKTDVAKIVFQTPAASDTNTMLSVLYALLEGMSTALGIERTDIKGTLHKVNWNNRLIYSIILYDAVAGGAGHVRRIVTKDGAAFQNVLHAAYDLVQGCDCDTSCYKCLRNYYNQKIHDQLDRHIAANFIKPWLGVMKPIEEQQQEEATTAECERNSSLDTVLHTDCEYDEDSTSWNEIIENLPLTDSDAEWVSALQKIAERDFLPFPVQSAHITVERSNDELWPDMAWPNLKLALYTSDNTDEYDNWPNCDWKAYKIGDDTLTPEKFAEIIRNTTIR